ncbi:hypothetical protein C817_02876 [Dorea sp. 5-2]|nr:hypothetical protein C817_02876 [Dorea sp. 5-2]
MKYAPRKVYIKESGKYVELSYIDFCRRRQADQSYMDKLFIPVQGCLMEVVREQYADFYKEKERWRYLKKLDTNHKLLSLDGFTDSEGNVLDFIVDEAVDVAETFVHAVMVDRLKAALPLLIILMLESHGSKASEPSIQVYFNLSEPPQYIVYL